MLKRISAYTEYHNGITDYITTEENLYGKLLQFEVNGFKVEVKVN